MLFFMYLMVEDSIKQLNVEYVDPEIIIIFLQDSLIHIFNSVRAHLKSNTKY